MQVWNMKPSEPQRVTYWAESREGPSFDNGVGCTGQTTLSVCGGEDCSVQAILVFYTLSFPVEISLGGLSFRAT